MKKITLLLTGSALLLSGCAGVKSRFDCDATTSDTCMTMTMANQLARDKAAKQAGKQAAGELPSLVNYPANSAAAVSSASRTVVTTPTGAPTGMNANAATLTPTPRPVAGNQVTPVSLPQVSHPTASVVTQAPSCQSVRCDNPGSVHPQRSRDQLATVWIAPWVDRNNVFHQPGRVSFVVSPADWVLPSWIN